MTPLLLHNLYAATAFTCLLINTIAKAESFDYSELDNAENSPCDDFYRHACLTGRTFNGLREKLLNDFNEMVDAEVKLLPGALDQMLADVTKGPTVDRKEFLNELMKRCADGQFLDNYLRAAYEEIGESSDLEGKNCGEKAEKISDVVLDDERESTSDLVDVIKNVSDIIAFDNLRKKDPRVAEAFRSTKQLFKAVQRGYLEFINITSRNGHSSDAMRWYQAAERVNLELLMRTYRFFNSEQLSILSNEYFTCTENWVLGIDIREKAFCLSRAWRLSAGMTPMSSRLTQYLHDLRSLNVNVVEDRVYVRPAYTFLLLNTTDELGTLGFEMAREITRASYEAPGSTHRCFQQQMNRECPENLEKCKAEENELIYNTVALRAVLSILQNTLNVNDSDRVQELLYSSALVDCNSERLAKSSVNTAFSQSTDFKHVFTCPPLANMVLPQENICRLL